MRLFPWYARPTFSPLQDHLDADDSLIPRYLALAVVPRACGSARGGVRVALAIAWAGGADTTDGGVRRRRAGAGAARYIALRGLWLALL